MNCKFVVVGSLIAALSTFETTSVSAQATTSVSVQAMQTFPNTLAKFSTVLINLKAAAITFPATVAADADGFCKGAGYSRVTLHSIEKDRFLEWAVCVTDR
jgi:hypothetical protein